MKQGGHSRATHRWLGKLQKNVEPEPRYLIPALQYVQSEEGYLPPEAMAAVAAHLGVSESKVFGVASFYSLFHFEPRGRNTVTVCRGTACHVRGSGVLLRELEKNLEIEDGGTTRDMLFSLQTVACFGSCALAPVVVMNDRVSGRQTTQSVKKLVDDIRASSTTPEPSKKAAGRRRSSKRKRRKASSRHA